MTYIHIPKKVMNFCLSKASYICDLIYDNYQFNVDLRNEVYLLFMFKVNITLLY